MSLTKDVCLLIAFGLLGNIAGSQTANAAPEPPRLVADRAVFDWGKLYQGENVEHTFTLTNTGGSPVVIRRIKPECGCTEAREEISDKTVQPGESIPVTLNVETAELKAGKIRKAADIVADHAGDSKLWMQGIVTELFRRRPEKAKLAVVRDKEVADKAELKVTLDSNLPKPVRIKEVKSEHQKVTLDLKEDARAGRFSISLKPKVPLDSEVSVHDETLHLKVEVEGKDVELSFPVKVQLEHRIQVSPFKSFFFKPTETKALGQAGAPLPSKVLEIKSQGGPSHRFKITKTEVKGGAFDAQLKVLQEGRRYQLTIQLLKPSEKSKKKIIRDKIILKTDDEKVPEIVIPGHGADVSVKGGSLRNTGNQEKKA